MLTWKGPLGKQNSWKARFGLGVLGYLCLSPRYRGSWFVHNAAMMMTVGEFNKYMYMSRRIQAVNVCHPRLFSHKKVCLTWRFSTLVLVRPVIFQDFSWFQDFFSSNLPLPQKKEVACIVSAPLFSYLRGCGESVQGALSSSPKGDPVLIPYFFKGFFYFVKSHPSTSLLQITQTFYITLTPVDDSLPLVTNIGMRVQEGVRKSITEFELKAQDMDTTVRNPDSVSNSLKGFVEDYYHELRLSQNGRQTIFRHEPPPPPPSILILIDLCIENQGGGWMINIW